MGCFTTRQKKEIVSIKIKVDEVKVKNVQINVNENKDKESFALINIEKKSPIKENAWERSEKKNKDLSTIKLSSTQLVISNKAKIEDFYYIKEELGSGANGKVYKVVHKSTELIRAMKVIKKEQLRAKEQEKNFTTEIEILSKLDHPNIMKIFEYYQDRTNYYIICEFCSGGELYDKITKLKFFDEAMTANIMKQLLSCVFYLHINNIVHRDLKPENILVESIRKQEFVNLKKSLFKIEMSPKKPKVNQISQEVEDNTKNNNSPNKIVLDFKKNMDLSVPTDDNNTVEFINNEQIKGEINGISQNNEEMKNLENENLVTIKNNLEETKAIERSKDKKLTYDPKTNFVRNNVKKTTCINKPKEEYFQIKLIDFGASSVYNTKKMTARVGTSYYIAPEVLKKRYTEKCDIWSCGVIMYILLSGKPPFKGRDDEEIISNVIKGEYNFSQSTWENVSEDAKNLIKSMLIYNYEDRISAEQALRSPWFKTFMNVAEPTNIPSWACRNIITNIKNLHHENKFQQATVAFIVRHLSSNDEIQDFKKVFENFDKNGDGRLTYNELYEGLKQMQGELFAKEEFDRVIGIIDQDQNGYIEYEEFLRISVNLKNVFCEKNLQIAFNMFDKDGDNKLSRQEIKNIFGKENKNEIINTLLKDLEEMNEGFLDFSQFKSLMLKIVKNKSIVDLNKEK